MGGYDIIVIGVGGMGSAAVCELARRGRRVLGIEQFDIAHDRGSSHGDTRIIRKAYFEHPDYVPLLHRTYDMWATLEQEMARQLVFRCGVLIGGPPQGAIIRGVQRSTDEHNLAIEAWSASETRNRFPAFSIPDNMVALYEPDAGYLLVEDCVRAHVDRARALGANIITNCRVGGWSKDGAGVRVATDDATYAAERLIITAGPWAAELLHAIAIPVEIHRKVVLWFPAGESDCRIDCGYPVFGFDMGDAFFYGFPAINGDEIKAGEHLGRDYLPCADDIDRSLRPADVPPIARGVRAFLPGVNPSPNRHSICMYAMTPDEHFIVDRHPDYDNVVFACGFSGHGFKFAPIIGSFLADLAMHGRTGEPVEFLSMDRKSLKRV